MLSFLSCEIFKYKNLSNQFLVSFVKGVKKIQNGQHTELKEDSKADSNSILGKNQVKKELDETNELSSFSKLFRRVKWYGFINTVSGALSRWKRALKFLQIEESTQIQLEMIDDKSFFQTEWMKTQKIEKNIKKKKPIEFIQNRFLRRFRKKTRFIRKYLRFFQQKSLELRQTILSKIKKILSVIPVFDPLGTSILWWEFFYFLTSIFLFIYLPYSVSFEGDRSVILSGPGHIIMMVFLIFDVVKNCNTAIYRKGEMIREHLEIWKDYTLSFELPLDILTLLSVLGMFQFDYSRSLFLLRIFYQQSLIEKFKDALAMSEKSIATIDLFKLFATVIYLCHVVACAWFLLGLLQEQQSGEGWIVKYEMQGESNKTFYINSYFYSVIMMSSVKGNIQPSTNSEKVLSTILAFGACVLFGYTITSITIILRNINTKRDNFNNLMSKINKYMRRYNVDPNCQSRARKYVEYVKDSSLEEKKSSQGVLNCLSKNIKEEIFISIFSQVTLLLLQLVKRSYIWQ